jgi:hypothetical protein
LIDQNLEPFAEDLRRRQIAVQAFGRKEEHFGDIVVPQHGFRASDGVARIAGGHLGKSKLMSDQYRCTTSIWRKPVSRNVERLLGIIGGFEEFLEIGFAVFTREWRDAARQMQPFRHAWPAETLEELG